MDLGDFDPHRPYVDDIKFPCPECTQEATRVTSVIDAWFDSGSMPFGQWHYPFENADIFEKRFPADFISEAIDQTRGWFYSLTAVATLIRGNNSYRNVVCLGHIVDAEGRKMSKSLGNVIDPWTVVDVQGADALRWYMLTSGTPWSPRRVSPELIEESLRKYLLTLWNTYSFWVTYAALEGIDPSKVDIPVADRPETDRWILAELDDTQRVVTEALEDFDATRGGKRLDRFVDDLSNWYVRRSRRRFWRSGENADTQAAFLTLWECLTTVSQLTAPYTPFISDEIYSNLTRPVPGAPDSVHLSDWPEVDDARSDDPLRRRMGLVRKLVGLGRSARTDANVRVRQPLAKAFVVIPQADIEDFSEEQARLVEEELNVKEVIVATNVGDFVTYEVKANFKRLGPRFGKDVKRVATEIARHDDPGSLVAAADEGGTVSLETGAGTIEIERDDLDVRIHPKGHTAFAAEGHYAVIIDLDMTDELVAEGIAREVVRTVQDLRKNAGLAVEDRIELWLEPSGDAASRAVEVHTDFIAAETLATTTHKGSAEDGDVAGEVTLDEGYVKVALKRA
jgi:isoleucyl-tRNA synthetase